MKKNELLKMFSILVLLSTLNSILLNQLLCNDLFFNTFSGQLSDVMIYKMLSIKSKYAWLNYLITPILIVSKTCFTALCFWVGSFLNSTKSKFNDYLRIAFYAELVFVFFSFIRTGLLYYFNFQTLTEIGQFQPFTLFSLLNVNNIPKYYHYPLALVSMPEAIYWIALALLLKPLISGSYWKRISFVAKTYGTGLLIWVSIVVFVTLNFTA